MRFRSALCRTAAFALLGLGWLTSGCLVFRLSRLGAGEPGWDLCSALFHSSCDAALLYPGAWRLGVPLASWGLVYFSVLGFIFALGGRWGTRAALLLGAAGAGTSLVLSAGLLSGRTPSCPLCLLIHAANLALLAVLWLTFRREQAMLRERGAGASGREQPWSYALLALAAIVLAVLLESYLFGLDLAGGGHLDREALLAAFDNAEVREIPPQSDDAFLGAAAVPVRLVVFSSFQCPGCRSFATTTARLAERFDGELAIAFRHFPLESECNPAVRRDLHPRSCEAAFAAEAARQQFVFWPYHDRLFASDLSIAESFLVTVAADSGLDVERWRMDRGSFATARRVWDDVELGRRLGVDATPTVFLDGRRVKNLSLPALELLIRTQLGGLE